MHKKGMGIVPLFYSSARASKLVQQQAGEVGSVVCTDPAEAPVAVDPVD
jgi:hypothetical protein